IRVVVSRRFLGDGRRLVQEFQSRYPQCGTPRNTGYPYPYDAPFVLCQIAADLALASRQPFVSSVAPWVLWEQARLSGNPATDSWPDTGGREWRVGHCRQSRNGATRYVLF